MMDDRMDHTIDEAAAEYHRPPAPPREEMWRRIEAARAGRAGPTVTATVLPFRRRARRFALPIGIAALLALAFGLGRVSVDDVTPPAPVATTGPAAPGAVPAGGGESTGADTATPSAGDPAAVLAASDAGQAAAETPAARAPERGAIERPRRGDSEPAGALAPELPSRLAAEPRNRRGAEPTPALVAAARQHLAQAETFLSLFRTSIRSGQQVEPVVPATARYLLASNRLLIDSPAAEDPAMRRLLGDVELVLAQIAQMPTDSADSTDERLITDGIEQRDLLLRIRAAAGDAASAPYQGVL